MAEEDRVGGVAGGDDGDVDHRHAGHERQRPSACHGRGDGDHHGDVRQSFSVNPHSC